MWTRADLKSNAKIVMGQNYWKTVLVAFLIMIAVGGSTSSNITNTYSNASSQGFGGIFDFPQAFAVAGIIMTVMLFSFIIAMALNIFLFKPLEVGCRRYLISARQAPGNLSLLSFGFKHSYMNIVKTQFFRWLYTFLWTLLLVVPGIIKSYEYRMMPYILAENPALDTNEVFARSREMMTGNKMNAFVLDLSFIGWHILGGFTCGLLNLFYVNPYQQSTNAELYEALRR
jgi:uncharacterized membrane protein